MPSYIIATDDPIRPFVDIADNMPMRPNGCDYQGRYPQAAECCTELGCDECGPMEQLAQADTRMILWTFSGAVIALTGVALVALWAADWRVLVAAVQ